MRKREKKYTGEQGLGQITPAPKKQKKQNNKKKTNKKKNKKTKSNKNKTEQNKKRKTSFQPSLKPQIFNLSYTKAT